MKKKNFLLTAVMLSFFVLSAWSCGSAGQGKLKELPEMQGSELEQQTEESAKGRYREEKIELPVLMQNIFDVKVSDDGQIKVLFEHKPGSFCLCESRDFGVTWRQRDMKREWLPEGYQAVAASFGGEGEIVVSAGKISEDPLEEKHPVGEYTYFKIEDAEENPKAHPLSLQLPEPKEKHLESGYGLSQIFLSQNNRLYGLLTASEEEEIRFQVLCFAMDSGSVLWSLDTGPGEIDLFGDKIYLNEHDGKVKILDGTSGEETEELAIPLGNQFLHCMDVDDKNGRIFYCNETGIYGSDSQLALTELLVDGAWSSLSDINYDVKKFLQVEENVFLAFVQNFSGTRMELLRYEYDSELPVQPEEKLVVYSLKNNNTVKKIISDFQSSHPEVWVEYQVGMEDAGAKEEADAISSLNTEMMAGKGPDILILNGLPWESYQEKGILEDVKGHVDTGGMFENIFQAYQRENAQYVVPISFKFPVLIGEKRDISHVNGPKELAEAAKQIKEMPAFLRTDRELMRYLFSIYWQRVQGEDKKISQEELREILERGKETNDRLKGNGSSLLRGQEEREKTYDEFTNDILLDGWNIKYKNTAMDLGYLSSVKDFADILNQGLAYQAISPEVFSALIAGVSKEAENKETAREFLTFALSEEEQKIFDGEMYGVIMGFPVNKAAYQDMISRPSQDELENLGKAFANLGESFVWPEPEQFEELEQKIEDLESPAMEDSVVIRGVLESSDAYLAGEKTIEDAVNEICQRLELYFAE